MEGTFMNELQIIFCSALIIGLCCHIMLITNKKEVESNKKNYKNIALMAQNLTNCKVSTRMTVLKELKEDPNWSKAELDELIGVLEGILDTKIYIDSKGLKIKK